MKRLLLTFALIFAFVCAQAADITSISNAFKAGNASSLSGAMDKVVDVALPSSLPTVLACLGLDGPFGECSPLQEDRLSLIWI